VASTSSSASSFSLTAEEKELASNFTANKGKLPWPVEKGYVTVQYGTQPHPINKSLTIKSNGVRIATEKGAKVRAVFNGEVTRVVVIKNANAIVMIRHGNYITAYKNLKSVYVQEGDKVSTNQDIGEVFTSPNNGETILYFSIYKEIETQNPASWIYKM
jgi:septal ring factor EnvC (AmiA/AmiB activator)